MDGVWRQTRKLSYWTSDDTKYAICTTLASAGIGFLVLSRDRDYHVIIKTSAIRAVLPREVPFYRVMDLLGYGSAGYATYLVYKYGGGFSYSDTTIALCLYGGVIVLDLATGFQSLFVHCVFKALVTSAAANAFYRVREEAGYWMVPLALWSGIKAIASFSVQ